MMFHSPNLILLAVFTFHLLKLLEWSLVVAKHGMNLNETHWKSVNTFPNKSTLNALCGGGYSEHVRVCSLPSQMEDSGNAKMHERVLVFRLKKTVIKIFLRTHHISLPDASVTYKTGLGEIPLYREDISKSLYMFYEGNLVFLYLSFPFSAEWDGIHFKGRTYFINAHFEILCANISESNFHLADHCFYCSVSCIDTQYIQTNNSTLTDYQALFDINHEFPELENSQDLFSVKTQLYRKHRNAATYPPVPGNCYLHLVADHLFYKYIGGGSIIQTINVMFSVINDADALFRSTDFDGDQLGDNIGFIIGKITVYPDVQDPNYNLSQSYLTSNEYLTQFSFYDFSDYCLGVGFTYRDFYRIPGSAFQAYSDDSLHGGICQKRLQTDLGAFSFNTLIVTFLNFGKTLKKSHVVLIIAHELGHSFGASHDMTPECHSESEDGHFLMSTTVTFGQLPNNPRFSACSIRSILPVIKKKGSCLIYSNQISHCGNTVPEIGEECDCGTSNICNLIDPCCTPADVENGRDKPCTIRRSQGKLCSPKVNPCCTSACTYIPWEDNTICNQLQDCSHSSVCNGLSGHCPFSRPLPNGTLCNNGFQVCTKGTCSQNVCEYYNLTSCVCSELSDQCKLCCKDPRTLVCEPATKFGIRSETGEIHQEPGETCSDNGYCDEYLKCASTSRREKPAVLGFRTSNELEIYVKNYWLYYVFAIFCIIFILSVMWLPYQLHDNRHMKALRYGKMLAIFSIGEHQTKIYRKTLKDIDDHYTLAIIKLHGLCDSKDHIEALGRLKLFFPEVRISYLSRIAKLSASEPVAVKILLLQGFKMRTFTTLSNNIYRSFEEP